MNLDKIKKQWDDYNDEFENSDFMDIDTHTSMALKVGGIIQEIENQQKEIKLRMMYEGFLKNVIRSGEDLNDKHTFEWFCKWTFKQLK